MFINHGWRRKMIIYLVYDNVEDKILKIEAKRSANEYLKNPLNRVWSIKGRRGSQINARFNRLLELVETNGFIPEWAESLKYEKQKRKRSEEHNRAISRALAGVPKSEAHKSAIGDSMVGNENRRKR